MGWASQVNVIYSQGRKPSAASLLGISQQDWHEEGQQALFVKSGDSNTLLLSVCKNTISAPYKNQLLFNEVFCLPVWAVGFDRPDYCCARLLDTNTMLLSGTEDAQGPECSSLYRQMFGNTTASSWFIDWFQDPFLIRVQDARFYIWGLGTRSSQRKTGHKSGIGEHNGRASSTDVCICYPTSRSRSQWHAVPLPLIQGLRSKELAADEGKTKWVQQKSREWFPQNTWFCCSEVWTLMCVR